MVETSLRSLHRAFSRQWCPACRIDKFHLELKPEVLQRPADLVGRRSSPVEGVAAVGVSPATHQGKIGTLALHRELEHLSIAMASSADSVLNPVGFVDDLRLGRATA